MSGITVHDSDAIADWLIAHIAGELEIDPDTIPLDATFFDIGLNSLSTVIISGELGLFLGHEELSPSLFWDFPTIGKLAGHLAAMPPGS